jgi:hypothetical protein
MVRKGVLSRLKELVLVIISSAALVGCFDSDGGTSANAKASKLDRHKSEKGVPVPESGNSLTFLILGLGGLLLMARPVRCSIHRHSKPCPPVRNGFLPLNKRTQRCF